MRDDLINFRIPASFVLARAFPTAAEIAFGYQRGWLRATDVVEIALVKYKAGQSFGKPGEELALLLPQDMERVDELIPLLAVSDEPAEERERLWLFLVLDWLWEHQGDFDDALEVIEMLYADFEYPAEIQGLVRFMPAPDGTAATLAERWRDYLKQARAHYRKRNEQLQS
jgi:hypothetical protein